MLSSAPSQSCRVQGTGVGVWGATASFQGLGLVVLKHAQLGAPPVLQGPGSRGRGLGGDGFVPGFGPGGSQTCSAPPSQGVGFGDLGFGLGGYLGGSAPPTAGPAYSRRLAQGEVGGEGKAEGPSTAPQSGRAGLGGITHLADPLAHVVHHVPSDQPRRLVRMQLVPPGRRERRLGFRVAGV
jgi:hypothetical protein